MKIKDLISLMQEIVYQMHVQNYHMGNILFRKLLSELGSEYKELLTDNPNVNNVMNILLGAMENQDMVLCADLLEEGLIPVFKEILEVTEEISVSDYILEIGSAGYYTVRHVPSGIYLHSNNNPVKEARELIRLCYDPGKEEYAVWGLGLGYHIAELHKMARGSVKIKVFEEDEELIRLAGESGIMESDVLGVTQLVHDPSGKMFAKFIGEGGKGILMHLPSIKKCFNKELQSVLFSFFASWNGTVQLKTELAVNFRSNIKNCKYNVDVLENLIRDKEIVIVAGGPSVDSRLEELRRLGEEKVVLAATTVLGKLLKAGVTPDFAVVMDSNQRTYGHMRGIEETEVPLIADSTAYWEFAAKHKGETYIAYQKGYEDSETRAFAEKRNTYETGGSVTTLMLEVVLQLGAKTVTFIGADFAFPGGVTHAKGTMDEKVRSTEYLEKTISVTGGEVYTDSLMTAYRKWIERKIEEYPDVEFYNMSDCGAKIKGTREI